MKVSIRELKAKLRGLIRRAALGENISITRHGKVIAYLTPARSQEEATVLAILKSQPWITFGRGGSVRGLHKGVVLRGKKLAAGEVLLPERE